MQYFIHGECPECEGDVYHRGLNLVEHKGLPVFDLDHTANTIMTCENYVYVKYKDEENRINEDDFQKLSDKEKEDYYQDECGYIWNI